MAVLIEAVSKNQQMPFSAHRDEPRLTASVHSVRINLPPRLYKSQPGVFVLFWPPWAQAQGTAVGTDAALLILMQIG